MKELIIDPEFQSLIPPLSKDEYQQLEKNIKSDGCRDALVVWDRTIVDGHNRYKICRKHRIPFRTEEINFDDRNEVVVWMLKNQLGRRNLSDFQRNEVALRFQNAIAKEMKKKQAAYYGNQYDSKVDFRSKDHKSKTEPTNQRKELARIAGTSEGSIYRTKQILEKGTPEQVERARMGGQGNSVTAIYQEVINKDKPSEILKPETMVCRECGEDLPMKMFPDKRRVCKSCLNLRSRKKETDWRGNIISISPDVDCMTEEEIIGDLYNTEKEVIHTIEDTIQDFTCNFESFITILDGILEDDVEQIKKPENNKKIMAILSEAVKAMEKMKGKYSYERL